jgi:putative redox protein
MSIQIQRKPATPLAKTINIRSHQPDADVAVAEKCPVHKLMTTLTTEITTRVERAV